MVFPTARLVLRGFFSGTILSARDRAASRAALWRCGNKMQRKLRAARRSVLDLDRRAMQFGNAMHNRKTKAGASLPAAIAAPEAAENQFAFFHRDSRTAIADRHRSVFLNSEFHQRIFRRVPDRVFGQIADRALDHLGIALDGHRPGRAKQRDFAALVERQRRDEPGNLGASGLQVGYLSRIDRKTFELGNIEQLTDDTAHRLDVEMKRFRDARIVERLDAGAQYAERRAQFMSGIRGA